MKNSMRSFYVICPKCNKIMSWNSYFCGYYCHLCGCVFSEDLEEK